MPSRYISRDGGILADRFTDGPYIFQNVHTLGGAARHTAAHTALLRAAAKSLFGFDPEITADELRRRIARLTEACRMPSRVSVRAVVRLYPTGSIEIACDEPSIYAGYVLRSLRPDAICLRMAPPLPSLPTSAAEHTRLLADTMARTRGARTAILTDSDGTVISESAQPIFIVNGYTVSTPAVSAAEESVERRLVRESLRQTDLTFAERLITLDKLAAADEIFTADHRGITSIARIGRKPYMSIIAERVATQIENVTL